MGISKELYRTHLDEQRRLLQNYRSAWPEFLFRHEPVENALAAFRASSLLSRDEANQNGLIVNDIAPGEILGNRSDAYSRVRLYFRPLTPTQYHIEGIRKSADYYMGKHGGFLVMLLFDAEEILTDPACRFSSGNMQSPLSVVYDDDVGFNSLDFSSIFHDSAYPGDDVRRKRCAEVLTESPLELSRSLRYIVARTDADAATLRYKLVEMGRPELAKLVRKSTGPGIFFNRFTAMDYVDIAPGRIEFKLRYSNSGGDIDTAIELLDKPGGRVVAGFRSPLKPLQQYYWEHGLAPGDYVLKARLEDCYAHESSVTLIA